MTDPPMYNVASAVLCRSLAIVRSLPLPGCAYGAYANSACPYQTRLTRVSNVSSRNDLLRLELCLQMLYNILVSIRGTFFYVRRKVDLMKTAKVNACIMHIFVKIEHLSIQAT